MAGIIYIHGKREDVLIGQCEHCDIRISDASSYEKDVLAYIVPDSEGVSWRLIRGDESVRILVNGEPLHLVYYLNVGDRLVFGNDSSIYRFAGGRRQDGYDTVQRLRKMTAASVVAAIFLMVVYIVHLLTTTQDDIRRNEMRRYESSVFKISVVEVMYQAVKETENGIVTDTIATIPFNTTVLSGTGFLCADGKFVTARHCIEPWITIDDPVHSYTSSGSREHTLAKWAADAETYNIRHQKDSTKKYRRLVTICEVSRNGSKLGRIASDTGYFCTRNDLVRNLRGVRNPLYWRELGHIRSRSSLGDIVYFQTGHKGRINIAGQSFVDSLDIDTPAVHIGYPVAHSECGFERSRLEIKRQKERCLEFKDTDVAEGYSGGPVMVRHNGKLYAAGVLSRIFGTNQRRCVCVPASEILNAERRWEE